MEILISISILAFVFLIAFSLKSSEPRSLIERLEKVGPGAAKKGYNIRDQEVMNKSLAVRVLLPLADKCSKWFSNLTPIGMLEQCRKDIASAGFTGKVTPVQLTTLSWMFLFGLPILVFLLTLSQPKESTTWAMIAVSGLIGYRMPLGIVQGRAKGRRALILKALPFTFDLISIGVEAGISFDGALALVAEKTTGPLTDEINVTLNEVRLGKARNDALKDFSDRVGLDDLRVFLTSVIYISKMGGSLVDVIRVQTDAMRVKRRQRAEETAMKAPVKIMFPLVLFIFPAIFVCILGPVILRAAAGEFSG